MLTPTFSVPSIAQNNYTYNITLWENPKKEGVVPAKALYI